MKQIYLNNKIKLLRMLKNNTRNQNQEFGDSQSFKYYTLASYGCLNKFLQ